MIFSDILYIGRCSYLGSLKFFLKSISMYLWNLFFQTTECLVLFFILNSFEGVLLISNRTGYNSIFVELGSKVTLLGLCLSLSHQFYFILTIFSSKVPSFLTVFTLTKKQLHIPFMDSTFQHKLEVFANRIDSYSSIKTLNCFLVWSKMLKYYLK